MDQDKRDRVVKLVREMLGNTVENGCTPSEAARFAAKAAEWIEKYQIEEAEIRAKAGTKAFDADNVEVYQNTLSTGKKVFNPGMTAVISGLATGMCCKVILLHQKDEAVYGIIGDQVDADYVCQIATTVVPALQIMARMEGAAHGYEKAGLIRWTNQYLTGAGGEIRQRIEKDRRDRSEIKQLEHEAASCRNEASSTALAVITGESIAVIKRTAVEAAFKERYPKTRTTYSRSSYDRTANECGRAAGKRVGLNVGLENK